MHMWMRRTAAVVVATATAAAALSGCAHVPSRTLVRDRFDYGQSVADSWKRQTLLNIVRIRYADAPVFMDVTTVITSYSVTGSASVGGTLYSNNAVAPNEFPFSAGATYSNTPTVTYQPLSGDRFMKSMLRPIPPAAIFQMLQAGWSAELILRMAVRSINGQLNQTWGKPAAAGFDKTIELINRLQRASAFDVRVEERKDADVATVSLPVAADDAAVKADVAALRAVLGLREGSGDFNLVFGVSASAPNEIAVLSRSMLEIMTEFSNWVNLPASEVSEGRALFSRVGSNDLTGGPDTGRLVTIHSGPAAPPDAYSAVPYRGRWYWIDDRDLASKVRFSFLMTLSSLAETGVVPAAPVVTVPSR